MRKILISFFLSFFFILPVSAATITIPKSESVNLIEMADKLHETYTKEDTTYIFSFNGNTLSVQENNPIILVNDREILLSTEEKNGLILPKYDNTNNLEMNYDKFFELTGLKHDKNGIIVEMEDEYEAPEKKTVENLDLDYVKNHIMDLGYTKIDGKYVYMVNNDIIQTVTFENEKMKILVNNSDVYTEINDLLVKTLLKSVGKENLYEAGNTEEIKDEMIEVRWTEE